MGMGSLGSVMVMAMLWMMLIRGGEGIRFVIDREECMSHKVEFQGDTVHVSFVVIKTESPWHSSHEGVDLVIKGPTGEQIHDLRDKTSEKYELWLKAVAYTAFDFQTNRHIMKQLTLMCKSVISHSMISMLRMHFNPLLEQISKLEEALYNIQFEQHWIGRNCPPGNSAVNEGMSRRAIHKAIFESAALVGASVLQVYLLQRLFELLSESSGHPEFRQVSFLLIFIGRSSKLAHPAAKVPSFESIVHPVSGMEKYTGVLRGN